jgi:hypothetical protein
MVNRQKKALAETKDSPKNICSQIMPYLDANGNGGLN